MLFNQVHQPERPAGSFASTLRMTLVFSAVAVFGCGAPAKTESQTGEQPKARGVLEMLAAPILGPQTSNDQPQSPGSNSPAKLAPDLDAPKDPQPAIDVVFAVDIYQLVLPFGAISQNAEFWDRLDEQRLDPAIYDVLQRNGIRVGEASFADWDFFKRIIEQHPGTSAQAVSVAKEAKNLEIMMKKGVQLQDIWHFDQRNVLAGRTFDKGDNIFSVSFEPTPRRPGEMRLLVAPIVRADRKRLEYSVLNDERAEVKLVNDEMLYACNLRLDVPLQSFIVIAPSPEASWPLSVGHAFMITQGKAQLEEQVLIIVPKPFQR